MAYANGAAATAEAITPVWSGSAVLRRAGLPRSVLDTLRFPDTSRTVGEILDRRSAVAARGRSTADALYAVIGALPADAPLRPRLVGLRRALHAGRRPTAKEWAPDLADQLPVEIAGRVRHWLAERDALESVEASLEQVFEAEVRERQTNLVTAAADPAFRLGLDIASPVLAEELDKWLDDSTRSPKPRTVLALARYLVRAASKTSPLGTFLTSGPVDWVAAGPAITTHPERGVGLHELAERSLREEIAGLIATRPEVRDDVLLRLNPSADRDGETISYVDSAAPHALCAIPALPAVRDVVTLLKTAAAGLPRRSLRHQLCGGDTALTGPVDAFIDHLVTAGLLVGVVPISRLEKLLDEGAAWLDARPGIDPGDRRLATALRELARALARPMPVDQVAPYRDHRRQLVARVRDLAVHARVGSPLRTRLATRTVSSLRDSVVTRGPLATCAVRAWEPVRDDLDTLRRWLAPFAPWLPARLALTELMGDAVAARGTVPLLRFYRELQQARTSSDDVYRELDLWLGSPTPMWAQESGLESVRRLAGVSAAAATALAPYPVGGLAAAPTGAGTWPEPVAIDMGALRDAAAGFPEWLPPVRSLEAAVQLRHPGEPELAVVVNTIMPGFGSVRARIDHLSSSVNPHRAPARYAALAPASRRDVAPDGPIYASFGNRFGFTLNDHRRVLPYTLADSPLLTPGDAGTTLAIDDLLVHVEEETGLLALRSRRHRRPVRVVHTGMVVSIWQHPFAHLLTVLSGESLLPAPVPPVTGVFPVDLRRDRPRLTAGRLTLVRGARRFSVAEVPVPRPGERPGRFLVRLEAWRRAERIPRRCFFTLWRTFQEDPAQSSAKWRKPIYLDFESWFLVQGLVNALNRPDARTLTITEALPDPVVPGVGDDGHVSELIIEVQSGS